MNFNEDLQEKYRDHEIAKLDDKVPLAADAAHILSEYLDTLAVEFVKQGIAEPYSIANQYEEMILNTLRERGTDKKITIEVIDQILNQFGNPSKVVSDYIRQNHPKRELILSKTPAQASSGKVEFEGTSLNERRGGVRDLIYSIPYLGYATLIVITLYSFVFGNIAKSQYEILYGYPNVILIISIIAAVLELISGITGQNLVSISHYKLYRKTLSTLFWYTGIALGIRSYEFQGTFDQLVLYPLLPAIIYQGVIILRDHGPGFYPLEPEFKPWIRYFTPSYILFGFSSLGIASLYILFRIPNGGLIFLMIVFLIIGLSSLVFDHIQNFPVSLRKNLFLTLHLFFFYHFMSVMEIGGVNFYFPQVTEVKYYVLNLTRFVFFAWIAVYVVLIFIVYQNLFRSQIEEYQYRLQEYSR